MWNRYISDLSRADLTDMKAQICQDRVNDLKNIQTMKP